jgi:serine/threonine protein phosphatase PrpC
LAYSEIGLVRKANQDSGFVAPDMLLVADGMGGAAAGDLASACAVLDLRHVVDEPVDPDEALDTFHTAVLQANAHLAGLIVREPALDGMGTTICGALFDGRRLNMVHIGDSRAYLLRDGELQRLTNDHSYVQSLINEGRLDEEGARHHAHRSLLLKVLNGQPDVDPDVFTVDLQPGDRLMFCSDGLCGLVRDAALALALRLPDLDDAMEELVGLAHAAGGSDNITIILSDVVEEPETPVEATLPGRSAGAVTAPAPDSRSALLTDAAPPASDEPTVGLLVGAVTNPDSTTAGDPRPAATAQQTPPGSVGSSQPIAVTTTGQADASDTIATPTTEDADDNAVSGTEATKVLPDIDALLEAINSAPQQRFVTSGLIGAAADPHLTTVLRALDQAERKRTGSRVVPPRLAGSARTPKKAPTTPVDERTKRVNDERRRYTPSGKRHRPAFWLIPLIAILALAAGGWGTYAYVCDQYYIAETNGYVGVYQGIPGDVAGIHTSRLYDETTIKLTDLPVSWRTKVEATIRMDSGGLEQAERTVQELRDKSTQCVEQRRERPAGEPTPADGC